VGSSFVFRVSRPGFDAATTDLDNLIFDGDAINARVAASGLTTVDGSTYPLNPATRTISHGVSNPGLALAVAESTWTSTANPEWNGRWWYMSRDPNVSGGAVLNGMIENDHLTLGWCTPWRFSANDGEAVSSAGYRIRWNSSSLFIDNFGPYGIRVRWSVLEF
jgi:hypothetical protein